MRPRLHRLLLGASLPVAAAHAQAPDSLPSAALDAAFGRPGTHQTGGVRRYAFPRGDLKVRAAGVLIAPALALGGWVAMAPGRDGAIAMGDLVLVESELDPVIARLQEGGIEQTAIHHHLLHESPRVYYVHIRGHGDPLGIASTVRAAVALTGALPPAAPAAAGPVALDTAAIHSALGYGGRVNGGVLQVSVPRNEVIRDGDFVIPGVMGLGTAINFQPTGDGRAAITSDFVLVAGEVNPVIRALRAGGIEDSSKPPAS